MGHSHYHVTKEEQEEKRCRGRIFGENILCRCFVYCHFWELLLLLLLLCLLLNRTGTSSRNVEFAEEMRNTFQMIYRNRQPFILSSLCVLSTVVLIWHKNCQFTVLSCSIFLYDDNNSHTMIILFLFIYCCHSAVGGWFVGWMDGLGMTNKIAPSVCLTIRCCVKRCTMRWRNIAISKGLNEE